MPSKDEQIRRLFDAIEQIERTDVESLTTRERLELAVQNEVLFAAMERQIDGFYKEFLRRHLATQRRLGVA